MKIHRHFYVAIVILAVAVVLGELYFRFLVEVGMGEKVPLSRPLSSIPQKLGSFEGVDVTIPPDMQLVIGAMDTLKRSYLLARKPRDVQIELYIAYFGGIRGTAPHHPDVCMPTGGWDMISSEVVPLKVAGFGDKPILVRRDAFEHISSQQKRLVVWWEYIHGENVASRMMQRLKWVLPKFMGGKRGSILQVQVGMDFSGDMEECWAASTDFIGNLGPYLHDVLPAGGGPSGPQSSKSEADSN
jgi:EpsI family protein